jgi:hypothetical protein
MLSQADLLSISPDSLAALQEKHGHGLTEGLLKQTRVALSLLVTAEQVFQPRLEADRGWEKARHIGALVKAVRRTTYLDPIVILPIGGQRIVVDGHCRLKAYRAAGFKDNRKVPVRYLKCSVAEALKHTGNANSKEKLPWTPAERECAAWRLTLFNEKRRCYSLRDIARYSGCGKTTAERMKNTLIEALPFDPRHLSWAEVKRMRRGEQEPDEAWTNRLIEQWAERLHKGFGDKPNVQPEAFLSAILKVYPRLKATFAWAAERDEEGELLDCLEECVAESPSDF